MRRIKEADGKVCMNECRNKDCPHNAKMAKKSGITPNALNLAALCGTELGVQRAQKRRQQPPYAAPTHWQR